MQTPWQTLELDPGTATEKDIKIAYARLLKQHRPDIDPEGFRRVREAYELGLVIIREMANQSARTATAAPVAEPLLTAAQSHPPAPSASTTSPSDSTTPAMENPALPPSLTAAEDTVTRALAAGDSAAAARAIGSLFYTCRQMDAGSAGIRLWQESLHRVTGGRCDLVASGVTCSQMMAEMEAGSSIIAHACIGHWESVTDMDSLTRLAEAMLSEPRRVNSPEAALVALRLALEVGFPSPALSMRLVNLAFPHLDRETREQVLPRIDQQTQVGALFAGFRDDQLRYWHQRFRRPSTKWNWNDSASDTAIDYLVSARDQDWHGLTLIKEMSPPDWWARLQIAQEQKQVPVLAGPVVVKAGRWLSGCGFSSYWWLNLIWVMPLAAYLGLLALNPENRPFKTGAKEKAEASPSLPGITSTLKPSQSTAPRTGADSRQFSERLEQLLKLPNVQSWHQLLRTMMRNTPVTNAQALRSPAPPVVDSLRTSLQSLFRGIAKAESDPQIEPHVLEAVLLDPAGELVLKQEALLRQATMQPPEVFLPIWRHVASGSPALATSVARLSNAYLNDRSKLLLLSEAEKHELELFSRSAPPISSAIREP